MRWFERGGAGGLTWGPSADIVIGAAGEEAWFTDRRGHDFHQTRAHFSAGYGASWRTQYPADEHGVAIEVAQSAAGEPFTAAAIEALVARCATLSAEFDIPARRIAHLAQERSAPVPRGFVGHQDTAHGRRTGKSDPGPRFPWAEFVQRVAVAGARAAQPRRLRLRRSEDVAAMVGAISAGGPGFHRPLGYDEHGRRVYEFHLP